MSRECPKPMKRAYSTRKRAKEAAAVGGRARGIELNTYRCPGCRMWHLTRKLVPA
jgi:hypothetical protein